MSSTVNYRCEGGLASLELTGRRVSWSLGAELIDRFKAIAADDDIRVVTLRSIHSDFSHGMDLKDGALLAAMAVDGGQTVAQKGAELIEVWSKLPQPTIVGVSGWVIGAGACLAVACTRRPEPSPIDSWIRRRAVSNHMDQDPPHAESRLCHRKRFASILETLPVSLPDIHVPPPRPCDSHVLDRSPDSPSHLVCRVQPAAAKCGQWP